MVVENNMSVSQQLRRIGSKVPLIVFRRGSFDDQRRIHAVNITGLDPVLPSALDSDAPVFNVAQFAASYDHMAASYDLDAVAALFQDQAFNLHKSGITYLYQWGLPGHTYSVLRATGQK